MELGAPASNLCGRGKALIDPSPPPPSVLLSVLCYFSSLLPHPPLGAQSKIWGCQIAWASTTRAHGHRGRPDTLNPPSAPSTIMLQIRGEASWAMLPCRRRLTRRGQRSDLEGRKGGEGRLWTVPHPHVRWITPMRTNIHSRARPDFRAFTLPFTLSPCKTLSPWYGVIGCIHHQPSGPACPRSLVACHGPHPTRLLAGSPCQPVYIVFRTSLRRSSGTMIHGCMDPGVAAGPPT